VSRGDLWPELVSQTFHRGIPVAVIAGAVRPSSRRLRWPARRIFASIVQKLSWIGAVAESDAVRWRALGARDVVSVTGDPRHDAVLERCTIFEEIRSLVQWSRERSVIVAGSVEHSDQDILIEAYRRVSTRHSNAALLLVPHEPGEDTIQRLTRKLDEVTR
jgi:3-deoxy-D-manno-octulosonic-acid transferase